ncbi:MAG: preprotein translocase subunit YajC [Kiritimatiellae bacterium]|nr:preprotein translocase subunit YajC [Kiritimatiellia bacterium]
MNTSNAMAFVFADADADLAAPQTAATVEVPAQADGEQQQEPQQGSFFGSPMMLMVVLFALFYVMLIRPQQRKEKERRKMIDILRAGTKVVFGGGIIGVIDEAGERTFKIEIAPGVKVEVLRDTVQDIIPEVKDAK